MNALMQHGSVMEGDMEEDTFNQGVSWVVRDVQIDEVRGLDTIANLQFQRARALVELAAETGTLEDIEDICDEVDRNVGTLVTIPGPRHSSLLRYFRWFRPRRLPRCSASKKPSQMLDMH